MPENQIKDYLENSVLKFNMGNTEIKVLSFKKEDKPSDFFGRIHAKSFFELRYVAGGRTVLMADGSKHLLKKGSLYVVGPEQLYHSVSEDGKICEYSIVLQFNDMMSELAGLLSSEHIIICDAPSECEMCIKGAERELLERGRFYSEKVINSIRSLLIYLVRENNKNIGSEPLPKSAKDDKYCIMIDTEFIFNLRGLTLKRLSDTLGLSERQCQRFLMNNYGMSYSEKLLQARMIKAADYLAFTDKDIQAIIEEVGYSESSYFSRIFKKHYGISPGEYRKKHRRY